MPFWLQVLSICPAPILGFAGVAIGAHLKDRSDRKAALSKERQEVYASYLKALAEYNHDFGTSGATAFRTGNARKVQAFMKDAAETRVKLLSLLVHIELIGSPDVVRAANDYLRHLMEDSFTQMAALRGGWDRELWNKRLLSGRVLMSNFRDAAIKNLQIPKKDRSRQLSAPEDLPDLEKRLAEFAATVDKVQPQETDESTSK